jgi:hypothetical protein
MQTKSLKTSWKINSSELKERSKPAQEISVNEIYEAWLDESPAAQSLIVIRPAAYKSFDVLINGNLETLPQESIFETGTAPPPDILTYSKLTSQIRQEEDQKILEMLSELMLNK